jgi:hypothetical protein
VQGLLGVHWLLTVNRPPTRNTWELEVSSFNTRSPSTHNQQWLQGLQLARRRDQEQCNHHNHRSPSTHNHHHKYILGSAAPSTAHKGQTADTSATVAGC